MELNQLQLKLKFRAACLQAIREFFTRKNYLEVMTPIAAREVIIDAHISPWQASSSTRIASQYFLHSSPEMHHKRLLAQGMTSLFEIAHVFRADEHGQRHHPEFLMLEWYGLHTDHHQQMEIVEAMVREIFELAFAWHREHTFPGTPLRLIPTPFRKLSYYELFYAEWRINPHQTSIPELAEIASKLKLAVPISGMHEVDDWLNLLLTEYLESEILSREPTFLCDYPVSQAALAKITTDSHHNQVASRFELYLDGVELCNGYHEQQSSRELESRMQAQNEMRIKLGQHPLPYCKQLIAEMSHYFPECAGVALGLDRLLMLAGGFSSLDDVVPFPPSTRENISRQES